MNSIKSTVARKAIKSTAKHTANGTGSKLRRDPLRSATLLAIGCAIGLLAGPLLRRVSGPATQSPEPQGQG